ncbi:MULTISPECIES: hypothetical protein [Leptospira]|nr:MULTISPECIES: hypothetical protein [Leptospira]
MFQGADPGVGWKMNDPIFGTPTTLGACVPNVRNSVTEGDYIFVVSGRVSKIKQFIVGGFQVEEKITAKDAYRRFPQYRQKVRDNTIEGNIIVNSKGEHNGIDLHNNFEKRIQNYIVGGNSIYLSEDKEIEIAREETLNKLSEIFKRKGKSVHEIIARWRKLDEIQINGLKDWLNEIRMKD